LTSICTTKCLIKLIIIMKFKVKYLQDGGQAPAPDAGAQGGAPGGAPAPAEGGAPGAEQGGQDPLMQIAQMFAQALQSQDCAALAQGAQMFLQLLSQAQGGQGGAEGGGAPPEQPVYQKKGGKIVKTGFKSKTPGEAIPPDMAKKGAKMGKKC
jgi:hypothetical protein